jgi:hypothetical protein
MRPQRVGLKPMTAAVAVALAISVGVLGSPAAAQGGDGGSLPDGDVGADVWAAGGRLDVSLNVAVRGLRVIGPGLPAWLRQCHWHQMTNDEFTQFIHASSGVAGLLRTNGSVKDWNVVFCPDGPEAQLQVGDRWLFSNTAILDAWQIDERPPQRFIDWAIARSAASVELPVQIGDSAPFGDKKAPMITQLTTWVWIGQETWTPITVTPEPIFGVGVTVTATPYRVVFKGGDDTVDCGNNTGPPYNFNLEDAQQHSNCTVTYHHTSAVKDWDLSSTIWWRISYACSAFCGSGTRPDMVINNIRPVTVAEIQAILVYDERDYNQNP